MKCRILSYQEREALQRRKLVDLRNDSSVGSGGWYLLWCSSLLFHFDLLWLPVVFSCLTSLVVLLWCLFCLGGWFSMWLFFFSFFWWLELLLFVWCWVWFCFTGGFRLGFFLGGASLWFRFSWFVTWLAAFAFALFLLCLLFCCVMLLSLIESFERLFELYKKKKL